jgi:DNA-binding NarL/FixJ family response regulator
LLERPRSQAAITAHQQADAISLAVVCGITFMTSLIIASLEQQGFCEDSAATLLLILDVPSGFAVSALADITTVMHQIVVMTGNLAPEYWDQLTELGAEIVIAGDLSRDGLNYALRHAAMGARYRLTPDTPTLLTTTQRRALHLLACGHSNQQIAVRINMKEQSIKNLMTEIFRKLGVADRNAAQNYYWGIWPAGTPH